MTLSINIIQDDKHHAIIEQTRARYQEFYDGLLENMSYEHNYLQDLIQLEQQHPGNHQDGIAKQKAEIMNLEKSILNLEQKIQRMDNIFKDKANLSLFVSKTTTKGELKTLMEGINLAKERTKNPIEIQFLTTISETAETCKDTRSNNATFDDQYIPLLKNEQKYAQTLITHITNKAFDSLIQSASSDPNASSDTDFFSAIKDIYKQAVSCNKTLGFTSQEHDFIQSIQHEIEGVVNNSFHTSGEPSASEHLQQVLRAKIDTLVNTSKSENNPSFSVRFKTFINDICKTIKIIPPIFKSTETKQAMIQKVKDMKAEMKQLSQENQTAVAIKDSNDHPPDPDIENIENTERNSHQSPRP
jgi:hypothetical protein